jgi:hypothetical protein
LPNISAQEGAELDKDGLVDVRRELLSIYKQRSYWDITNRLGMANPASAASMEAATGRIDDKFTKSYIIFLQMLDSGTLGIPIPLRPRVDCNCTAHSHVHRHPEDIEAIVDFWLQLRTHANEHVRVVGLEASTKCSIRISQSDVESSFAMLTNRQHGNTKLAGPIYLRNLAMLAGNRTHLADMYRVPMLDLVSKLGR